jgi:hypothetical protein
MAANAGRVKDHEAEILLEDFHYCLHVFRRIVDVKSYAQAVVAVRRDDSIFGELLDQ